MTDTVKTEQAVERIRAGSIEIHEKVGGMMIETVDHLFRIADALSRSGVAVPPHCRDNPGTVFALLIQAQEWGLPFLAVLNKSYVVNNRGVERVAYEAQLVHTLIETRANLQGKLREEYIGEGDDMICRVSGTFRGEKEPHIWESEKLGKIKRDIGKNDSGKLKGSPLWETRPRLQLKYATTRDWARAHCPWVILGVYTPDEFATDVTPEPPAGAPSDKMTALVARLQDRRQRHTKRNRRGFDPEHVNREADKLNGNVIEGDAQRVADTQGESNGGKTEGSIAAGEHGAGVQHDTGHPDDQYRGSPDIESAGSGAGGADGNAGTGVAGGSEALPQDRDSQGNLLEE